MHTAESKQWNLLANRPFKLERFDIEYAFVHALPPKPCRWLGTGGDLGGIPITTTFRNKKPLTGKVPPSKDFDQGQMFNKFTHPNLFPKKTHHENGRRKTQEEQDAELEADMQDKRGLATSA